MPSGFRFGIRTARFVLVNDVSKAAELSASEKITATQVYMRKNYTLDLNYEEKTRRTNRKKLCSPTAQILIWLTTALSTIFTLLRTYLPHTHNHRLHLNDILILLALLLLILLSILKLFLVPLIHEIADAPPDQKTNAAYYNNSTVPFTKLEFASSCLNWTAL